MENVGMLDKMVRYVIAIVFIIVGFIANAWWFLLAAYALITAVTGTCWVYSILKIGTNPAPEKKRKK
jgi:hypothetical protein